MNVLDTQKAKLPRLGHLPAGLPAESELQLVLFVTEREPGQSVLLELPPAFRRFAVLAKSDAGEQTNQAENAEPQFEFLTIPVANHQDPDLQKIARVWVDVASRQTSAPLQMMTLQGAQIFWNGERVAILASVDRLPTLRSALIEACWYEAELSNLERTLAEAWPKMENDIPLAFTFDEKSLARRAELQQRFQQIMAIRSRVARLAPHVLCPHLHPPTLASQIGERFRERTRLLHRHEILGGQLEVFEKIYEACGQRASDLVQSRTGHMLEWIIIVLLTTQILLWGFEILTNLEPTALGQ